MNLPPYSVRVAREKANLDAAISAVEQRPDPWAGFQDAYNALLAAERGDAVAGLVKGLSE